MKTAEQTLEDLDFVFFSIMRNAFRISMKLDSDWAPDQAFALSQLIDDLKERKNVGSVLHFLEEFEKNELKVEFI